MAKQRISNKPWVIARVEKSTGFCRSDRFFNTREEAEKDFEENRDYHVSLGHQIMPSKEYYEFAKANGHDVRFGK